MTLRGGAADIAFPASTAQRPRVSTPELPCLSIVIVAYRSRAEISPCLASLPQTLSGRPVEIVVVDNAPEDGTGDVVRAQFPHVTYLATGQNLGFGRANNLG